MIAAITGATKGIGKAIALAFAKEGFDIALCARSADDLAKCQTELTERYSIRVLTQSTDMAKPDEVKAFAHRITTEWGAPDVVVNNAGVFFPGSVQTEEEGTLEQMINTNLYSAYHFTRALLPGITERGSGHIFNMCSIASQIAYPNGGSYSISKFALLGFSKVLREELKEQGIRVTAILPGATWSASWEGIDLPESRLMKADDVARVVWAAYQLSDQAVLEEVVLRPQLGDL